MKFERCRSRTDFEESSRDRETRLNLAVAFYNSQKKSPRQFQRLVKDVIAASERCQESHSIESTAKPSIINWRFPRKATFSVALNDQDWSDYSPI